MPVQGGAGRMLRAALFIDGNFFASVSDYYKYQHAVRGRIDLRGLIAFVTDRLSKLEGEPVGRCQVTEAHYFRGRFPAKEAIDANRLEGQAHFDDVLIRSGIIQHYVALRKLPTGQTVQEIDIDVWLSLEAYDLAVHKGFDVLVLIGGNSDYVPLVRKLHTLGIRTLLLAWDIPEKESRTSGLLLETVNHTLSMARLVDDAGFTDDPLLAGLFYRPGLSDRTDGGGR